MFLDDNISHAGILYTPRFIPSFFQEVDILQGNLPVINQDHSDICVISYNNNSLGYLFCISKGILYNGGVSIIGTVDESSSL